MTHITFYLNRRRSSSANGPFPLFLAIRHAKTCSYIPTGIKLRADQWNGTSIVSHPYADDLNARLFSYKHKTDSAMRLILERPGNQPENATDLKIAILSVIEPEKAKRKPELFFSRYVRFMEERNSPGTRDIYDRALKKVVQYDSEIHKKDIRDLNKRWVIGFADSMKDTCNDTTRNMMLRCLHAVFMEALADGIIKKDPVKDVLIHPALSQHRSLSVEELRRIRDADVAPWQEEYRDIFMLLVYLRGINITDLITARPSQLREGRLDYIRMKTHKEYSVKIEPEAMAILDKYRGKDWLISPMDRCADPKTYIQHINRALKTIGLVYKTSDKPKGEAICSKLSTYWARHTWATLARELDISADTIGEGLGHRDIHYRVTYLYIRPENKLVDEANRKVIDYINGNPFLGQETPSDR